MNKSSAYEYEYDHDYKSRPGVLDVLRSRHSVHLLETIVMVYIAVCTLWYSLHSLTPFFIKADATVLVNFPMWLRIAGVVLLIAELIMISPRRRAPLRFLLYGICLSALISSFIYIRYGFLKNYQTILTMFEVFAIFYGASYAIPRKRLRSFVTILYTLMAIIWFIACCLSLVQFFLQIGVNGPNHSSSIWLRGTGLLKGRLTGIFGYPEYGGITGVILLAGGVYYFLKSSSVLTRVILVILNVPVYLYIVLCGSRNAAIAFFEMMFVGALLLCRKYFRSTAAKGIRYSIMLSVAVLLVSVLAYVGTRAGSLFIQGLIPINDESAVEETAFTDGTPMIATGNSMFISGLTADTDESFSKKKVFTDGTPTIAAGSSAKGIVSAIYSSDNEKIPAVALPYADGETSPVLSVRDNSGKSSQALISSEALISSKALISSEASKSSQALISSQALKSSKASKSSDNDKTTTTEKTTKKTTRKETGIETEGSALFSRTYRDGDFTTGRLKVWRNYFRLSKEIGLFGLSPENLGFYVREHHPKMYIVTSIENSNPALAESGFVFHPHNGYIKVYASAGYLGALLMLIFLISAIVRTIRWTLRHRTLSLEFIAVVVILMVCASSAMFDLELFFVFNPSTFLFWLCMSLLFKITSPSPRKRSGALKPAESLAG